MSWGFRGWVLATITDGSENFQDIYLLSVPASLLPCIHTAVILYQLSFSLCSFPLCESGYLCSFPWPFLPVLCCKASHLKWATQLLCSFIYSLRRVPNTCQVLLARPVKRSSAMQETWVQSLGWEDPLEKGKATHSNILAWRIPGITESDTTKQFSPFLSFFHLLSADDIPVIILKEICI